MGNPHQVWGKPASCQRTSRFASLSGQAINIRSLITYINVQISALTYFNIRSCMRCQYIAAAHLFKATAATYIVRLLIQRHPVYKRFWLIAIVDWAFKIKNVLESIY
jgi:hypothetical protein